MPSASPPPKPWLPCCVSASPAVGLSLEWAIVLASLARAPPPGEALFSFPPLLLAVSYSSTLSSRRLSLARIEEVSLWVIPWDSVLFPPLSHRSSVYARNIANLTREISEKERWGLWPDGITSTWDVVDVE